MTQGSYLITGGSGSFGQQIVRDLLTKDSTKRVVLYSRCEHKHEVMRETDPIFRSPKLEYVLGDIRDERRLQEALHGVRSVVHAAALKQVPAGQRNPVEFIKTNIQGSINVCLAAWKAHCDRVLMLSSDKAVDPRNLYGTCKRAMEDFAVTATGRFQPLLVSCTRWGNVWGTHGSVMERWARGPASVQIHGWDMTRFVLTLKQASAFALGCLRRMTGGEIFVPKLPAVTLKTIFDYYFNVYHPFDFVGIRGGEKLHETLIAEHEMVRTKETDDYYVIYPAFDIDLPTYCERAGHVGFKSLSGQTLTSDTARHLTLAELRELVGGARHDLASQ